jgi:hypothetical protein
MVILSLRQLNSKIAMVIQIKNLLAFKAMESLNYDHRIVEIAVWAQSSSKVVSEGTSEILQPRKG